MRLATLPNRDALDAPPSRDTLLTYISLEPARHVTKADNGPLLYDLPDKLILRVGQFGPVITEPKSAVSSTLPYPRNVIPDSIWDSLNANEEDWDGHAALPIPPEGLMWLKTSELAGLLLHHKNAPDRFFLPVHQACVFPTVQGGVEFLWEEGDTYASLEIDLESRQGDLHISTNENGNEHEEIDFSLPTSVDIVIAKLRQAFSQNVSTV